MNAFDFVHNLFLILVGSGRLSVEPLVERSTRDFQNAAHHDDRPAMLMLRNELQPHPFSLAKNAVAFFKMSRSILS